MNSIATHPDFDFPVNYTTGVLPDSGDSQVVSTIDMMRSYVVKDAKSPVFNQAISDFQLVNKAIAGDPCKLAYMFAKSLLRFQRDELTGAPVVDNVVEVLVRPIDAVLLNQASGDKTPGDCDCFSMLVVACLLAQGVPCAFATVAGNREAPEQWSHVYVVAWPGDVGLRTPIDASHGPYCGWEAPTVGRYTEWPMTSSGYNAVVVLGFLVALAGILIYVGAGGKR